MISAMLSLAKKASFSMPSTIRDSFTQDYCYEGAFSWLLVCCTRQRLQSGIWPFPRHSNFYRSRVLQPFLEPIL